MVLALVRRRVNEAFYAAIFLTSTHRLIRLIVAIPFYIPGTTFALKNGGKDGSATIADAFDVCGFGLLAVFNGFVARVLDVKTKQAWLPVLSWMLGGLIVAMASMFRALWLEGESVGEND